MTNPSETHLKTRSEASGDAESDPIFEPVQIPFGAVQPEDERWMALALDAARQAAVAGEVPVGAVLVGEVPGAADRETDQGGKKRSCATAQGRLARPEQHVLASASNRVRTLVDPTAHAEILVIRAALAARIEADPTLRWPRLEGTTLYTTVEPCFMCAGALVHARVARVVWGVRDPKFGGAASLGHVLSHPGLNHRARLTEGVLGTESAELLRTFFRNRR